MKGINLYLEYLLIFVISLFMINFVYNYYENNKTSFSILFLEREEDISIKDLDSNLKNILNFYDAFEILNLKINGECRYDYAIFYKSSNCIPNILNITYSEDLIINNDSYYLYSNLTNLYYLVFRKTSISFEGCYEGKYSYIIKTDFCDGICRKNCNLIIKKDGKNINILIK